LSTESSPKQFLDLLGAPLFEATLTRLEGMPDLAPAYVVTGTKHLDAVERSVSASGVVIESVLVEPQGRNTAPAIIAAALLADPDDVLVVLPADHLIEGGDAFLAKVEAAVSLAIEGHLILFGIVPTRPETGYGYIEIGEPVDAGFHVVSFVEKPDRDRVEDLLEGGRHLWNSGMFVFTARAILEQCAAIRPDLLTGVKNALPLQRGPQLDLAPTFADVDSISIDHALMEHTDRAVVVPIDVGWSDVGSWETVWESSAHDASGNVLVGDVSALDVSRSYVHSTSRLVAIAGVEDLVVVETPEAVLVVPRRNSQLVRDLVVEISRRRRED